MLQYDGKRLTPIFYSEKSSSYMLYDIFKNHTKIISELIYDSFKLVPENIIVDRERSYPKKGSIDIFIEFMNNGKKHALLFEVKVHDYLSATDGQIETYYSAVIEDSVYDEVYFIYLTQFTENDNFTGISIPKTIDEARKSKELIKERFVHLSWSVMHDFLEKYTEKLTPEQQLMVSLNRQWITHQCNADLENNKIDTGERGLDEYFFDINIDIKSRLPFGSQVWENKRQIWRVNTSNIDEKQLDEVLCVIREYSESTAINKLKQYKTEEETIQAAKDFLAQMSQSISEWKQLAFYSRLFLLAESKSYLKFNGKGTRGFSIKLETHAKGEISLCTIYRNKTIDFSYKR